MARLLEQLTGQDRARSALLKAVADGRLPHALLLSGPSGVGKRLLAWGLAQALICEQGREACGTCPSCVRVAKQQHESLLLVEAQAGAIKIEQVRAVAKFLSLGSWSGARVVIIDQAHTMNPQAANAALKLLEEPPPGTHFILVSSNVQALLPTIRSRCQIYTMGPLDHAALKQVREMPDWIVEACQGRLDLAEQLGHEELAATRKAALNLFSRIVEQEKVHFADDWREIARDRESALFVVGVWEQLLRDTRLVSAGVDKVIHRDWLASAQQLARAPDEIIDQLFSATRELESDIQANVDRVLATECFLLKAERLLA